MSPLGDESQAREVIDRLLSAAGWFVYRDRAASESLGDAIGGTCGPPPVRITRAAAHVVISCGSFAGKAANPNIGGSKEIVSRSVMDGPLQRRDSVAASYALVFLGHFPYCPADE